MTTGVAGWVISKAALPRRKGRLRANRDCLAKEWKRNARPVSESRAILRKKNNPPKSPPADGLGMELQGRC